MKQIIPFKKELPFKTKVSEITSISLEREIEIKEDGIISGAFHITGDYKMNEGSINRENYSFDLPFDITLDPRYDITTVSSDIEDFYYDVVNEDTLRVNIDLYVEAEYKTEEVINSEEESNVENNEERSAEEVEEHTEEDNAKEDITEEIHSIKETETEEVTFEKITPQEIPLEEEREEKINLETDLFSNLDSTETYSTYYVYIVKEEDTVEKILTKYEITKEQFEDYNDINNIKAGDKVIIPKKGE